MVIWAFAFALYRGNLEQGLKFARRHAKYQVEFETEILSFSETKSDDELADEVTCFALCVQECVSSYVDRGKLSKYMSRYPEFPCPDSIFVSKKAASEAAHLFDVLARKDSQKSGSIKRKELTIDYKKLGKGNLRETRFVLGKIILETLSGGLVGKMEVKKRDISSIESTSQQGAVKKLKDDESSSKKTRRRSTKRGLLDEERNRIRGRSLKGEEEEEADKGGLEDDGMVDEERYRDDGAGKCVNKVKDRRQVEKINKVEKKRDMASNTGMHATGEEGGSGRPLSSLFR